MSEVKRPDIEEMKTQALEETEICQYSLEVIELANYSRHLEAENAELKRRLIAEEEETVALQKDRERLEKLERLIDRKDLIIEKESDYYHLIDYNWPTDTEETLAFGATLNEAIDNLEEAK